MSEPIPQSFRVASHCVRGYEAGIAGNLKFVNCLHYLQEASELHAEEIGVGLEYTKQHDLIWVLSRYHVRLHRYPAVGESVHVATWPAGWQRILALREFAFLDRDDQLIGEASSAWLLVRAKDFSPVRPQEHLPEIVCYPRRMVDDDFRRLPVPEAVTRTEQFRVRIHDLDVNRHVNNAVYVEWALEAVPTDAWNAYRPFQVEAQFVSMAFQGETIQVDVEERECADGRHFVHRITRPSDGRELTRLRSHWHRL